MKCNDKSINYSGPKSISEKIHYYFLKSNSKIMYFHNYRIQILYELSKFCLPLHDRRGPTDRSKAEVPPPPLETNTTQVEAMAFYGYV